MPGPRPQLLAERFSPTFVTPKNTRRTNVVSPPRGRPKDPQQQTDFA